jgi:hypothetical protein
MGNDGNVGTGTGGISILAIFVVLCLTTLAALSLVSAQADSALAERAALSSVQYYEADAAAEEKLAEIVNTAGAGGDWRGSLVEKGYAVGESSGAAVVAFDEPINDVKQLKVEIKIILDSEGNPTGEWERSSWQAEALPVQEENRPLPLLEA